MVGENMTKVLGVKDEILYFWNNLSFQQSPFFILDIILVSFLIYSFYIFLKETRAIRILYGIIFILVLFFLSEGLNLITLNYILKGLTAMFVVAIPVIFQPELRSLLEKIGRADIVSDFKKLNKDEISQIILEIISSVKFLSKNKIGALIVISQKTGIKNIIDTGTKLDAKISTDLILTIFQPKSPLHDGAVIIKGNRIVAAGTTLPLTEHNFDFHSGGTRHRAALGLSEQSDAIIIVVSEEKGTISIASRGVLNQDIDLLKMKNILEDLIQMSRLKSKK
jgi:diadenylate cyclase